MDILSHYLSEVMSDLYLLDTAARKYKPGKAAFKAAPPKSGPSLTLKSLHGSKRSLLNSTLPHSSAFWRFSARS